MTDLCRLRMDLEPIVDQRHFLGEPPADPVHEFAIPFFAELNHFPFEGLLHPPGGAVFGLEPIPEEPEDLLLNNEIEPIFYFGEVPVFLQENPERERM